MKKLLLSISGLLLYFSVNAQQQVSQQDLEKGITGIFEISEAARAARLQRQNDALKKMKDAFDALSNGGNYDDALHKSIEVIETYQRYAAPYLLASYASLQLNRPLDAHRFLLLYDKFSHKTENVELSANNIPPAFIDKLRTETNAAFSKMTDEQLKSALAKDYWNDISLDIGLDVGARTTSEDGGVAVVNHLSGSFSKFLWFTQKDAFPTLSAKNKGIELKAGVDYKFTLGGGDLENPSREQLFFQPGFFLGRWYIAPVKIRFNHLSGYSGKGDVNSIKGGVYGNFSPLPEVRFYPFNSGYAHNFTKDRNPLLSDGASYLYLRVFDAEEYSGSANGGQSNFYSNESETRFGAVFATSNKLSVGVYIGIGQVEEQSAYVKGGSFSSDAVKAGLTFKYRIF